MQINNVPQKDSEEKKNKVINTAKAFTLVSTVSFQLAGSVLLGVFVGRYLDRWLGTTPWLMIVGLLLGLTAGITGIIKITSQFFGKEN